MAHLSVMSPGHLNSLVWTMDEHCPFLVFQCDFPVGKLWTHTRQPRGRGNLARRYSSLLMLDQQQWDLYRVIYFNWWIHLCIYLLHNSSLSWKTYLISWAGPYPTHPSPIREGKPNPKPRIDWFNMGFSFDWFNILISKSLVNDWC